MKKTGKRKKIINEGKTEQEIYNGMPYIYINEDMLKDKEEINQGSKRNLITQK